MGVISSFRGEYFFLSNFYEAPVNYMWYTFRNNEAAFQGAKDLSRIAEFCNISGKEAKSLGRQVHLRSDWEEIKEQVMYDICLSKFSINADLREKLLYTGNALLVEGNTWGDREWGVCNGVGKNKLGKILMRVREELRE